jgi:hypothetical protein
MTIQILLWENGQHFQTTRVYEISILHIRNNLFERKFLNLKKIEIYNKVK